MSETDGSDEHPSPTTDPNSIHESEIPDHREQPPRKRQRIRLSCLECRRRKLSCGRGCPCERCVKSGTPERCTYEPIPSRIPSRQSSLGLSSSSSTGRSDELSLLRRDFLEGHDRIRKLEEEVSNLKILLSQHAGSNVSPVVDEQRRCGAQQLEPGDASTKGAGVLPSSQLHDGDTDKDELCFFRGEEFQTRYFGPHNACMAFSQLTGLTPFMREIAEEWLKPLHLAQNPKDRATRYVARETTYQEPAPELEALLPSKTDTNALISVYLDQFEQLHRIIHVPSFRKEYASFWDPARPRQAAFTALILSMMSISSCMSSGPLQSKFAGMVSCSHQTAERWITACEEWQRQQSQKHRKLIHHQIACLLFLTKRVNTIKKKRFWTESGILVREGISLGLHRDPVRMPNAQTSPFQQEMRRRIWATIQEFDLQAGFDNGPPTLDSCVYFDVDPPRNLNDEDFDENSTELAPSRPIAEYTASSYQHLARQTLPLRLELGRLLSGARQDTKYEDVIRYTDRITEMIDSLPSWNTVENTTNAPEDAKKSLLAFTMLRVQLLQYIFPLHQPYLSMRRTNSRYQFSETIYYNTVRDMILLHDRLMQQNIQTLNFLRDDALTLGVNLCNIALLVPLRGSTNMIVANAQLAISLLDKCLAMKEDHILRCGNNEPWGYSIMCAAYGLLQVRLNDKDPQTAKAACAEQFINLHYRLLAGREPPISGQRTNTAGAAAAQSTNSTLPSSALQLPTLRSKGPYTPTPWWLPNGEPTPATAPAQVAVLDVVQANEFQAVQPINPNFSMELLGLNLTELWADTLDGFQ